MREQRDAIQLGEDNDAIDSLAELISNIRIGMLTTQGEDACMRSRPMLTAKTTFDGDLWFFTDAADGKVDEIRRHPHVAVSYADPEQNKYVSVSGDAEIVDDQAKRRLLWDEDLERWLPNSRDDALLVRISVVDGEYWDLHRNLMFKLGRWVKGMVSDKQPDELEHRKISLQDSSV